MYPTLKSPKLIKKSVKFGQTEEERYKLQLLKTTYPL